MDENQLIIVKEYKFDNPLIHRRDSIIDNCYRDCRNKYIHTFEYVCVYDFKLTNITNNETDNFTIFEKSLGLYDSNKKLTIAHGISFVFNHINKLIKKIIVIYLI